MKIANKRMEFTITTMVTIVVEEGEDISERFVDYDTLCDLADECCDPAYAVELNGESIDENFIDELLK